MTFAPLSLGVILAMILIILTIILMLPFVGLVPVPWGLGVIAIAATKL